MRASPLITWVSWEHPRKILRAPSASKLFRALKNSQTATVWPIRSWKKNTRPLKRSFIYTQTAWLSVWLSFAPSTVDTATANVVTTKLAYTLTARSWTAALRTLPQTLQFVTFSSREAIRLLPVMPPSKIYWHEFVPSPT